MLFMGEKDQEGGFRGWLAAFRDGGRWARAAQEFDPDSSAVASGLRELRAMSDGRVRAVVETRNPQEGWEPVAVLDGMLTPPVEGEIGFWRIGERQLIALSPMLVSGCRVDDHGVVVDAGAVRMRITRA
jgi:hypothetical protein